MRRGKERKKIQTKTNNTKHRREESLCTALVKMARDQECTEIKKEAIFQGRGGRREMLLLSFLCIQGCSPCFPSRSVCNIQVFPSEDAACSTANFSLLIMTSFSELPCLDSLQVVCIFPGALQTRGGNLQRSTKRGNGKKSLHGCELQSSPPLNRWKRKLLKCLSHPLATNRRHLEWGQHRACLWEETIEEKCHRSCLFNSTA